jgi:hypothetical protein
MAQEIIIFIILAFCVFYAGRRIYIIIEKAGNPCYGCKGCELHNKILANSRKKCAKNLERTK